MDLDKVEDGKPLPGSFTPPDSATNSIPSNPSSITPGAGGRLSVPLSRFVGSDDDDGPGIDGDFSDSTPEIMKPPQDGFIKIHHKGIIDVDLYRKQIGYDSYYYYIGPKLQRRVREDVKRYRIIPYAYDDKIYLWVLSHPSKSDWYNSVAKLFMQTDEFYAENEVRIRAVDRRYEVRTLPNPTEITWPTESTNELLADAIGPQNFILTSDHPIYKNLTAGNKLK
jgi:hypothetical protein